MKLSIITVCYNAGLTIGATLNSIENNMLAGYENEVEYIIVDGGSTDQTVDIIGRFCKNKPYARYYSDKDKGIYDAYNKGVSFAAGEFVWFVNADDVIRNNAIDVIIEKLMKYENVDLFCFSISRVSTFKEEGRASIRDKYNPIRELSPVCHTPGIIWRRCALENINGFDISYKICADFKALQLLLPTSKLMGFEEIIIDMFLGGVSSKYEFEWLKAKEQHRVIFTSSFKKSAKIKASSKIIFKLYRNLFINPIWRKIKNSI